MAADSSHYSNQHAIHRLRNSQDWNIFRFQFLAQFKLMLCLQNAEQAAAIHKQVPHSTSSFTSAAISDVLQQCSAGSWQIAAVFLVNLIPHLFQAFKTFNNQVKYDFKNDEKKAGDDCMIETNNCAAVIAYAQNEQNRTNNNSCST
jgi:hypothetical protein